ncbi:MAG: NAD(P)H-binding protein, partial [Cytophagales bacterium]|nr:NAD(P)H-binding protein [Cytophagales bacterium]
MKTKVLVTGATGNVGAPAIGHLLEKYAHNVEVTAAVTDVARARQVLLRPGLHFVRFNFEDPSTVRAALAGVDKLFLLRPPQLSDVQKYIEPVILAAKAAGVKHLVFLSLQGVVLNKGTPLYKIEQFIQREGLPYTCLR